MESNSPKITVIIATFNAGKTLTQALDSIRHQSYKNIETIIVDGKSSDNTIDVILSYSDIVTKYVSEKDTGIYNAFNKGLRMATGDYVGFLGADDCYYDYDVFHNIVSNIEQDTLVLQGIEYLVDNTTGYERLFNNKITREEILAGKMMPHAAMFVKREILLKYMFNENNRIISDYEFLLRYTLDGGSVKKINLPIAYFSNGGISSSEKWSDYGLLRIYEHVRLMVNLDLDKKYFFMFMRNNFADVIGATLIKRIKRSVRWILEIIGVFNFIQCIRGIHRKHKCNLKYCRWCGKYEY